MEAILIVWVFCFTFCQILFILNYFSSVLSITHWLHNDKDASPGLENLFGLQTDESEAWVLRRPTRGYPGPDSPKSSVWCLYCTSTLILSGLYSTLKQYASSFLWPFSQRISLVVFHPVIEWNSRITVCRPKWSPSNYVVAHNYLPRMR